MRCLHLTNLGPMGRQMSRAIRVVTILGTRPEIVRLSRLIPSLDDMFDHKVIHTGQNEHPKLSAVFFDELGIRGPDIHFETDTVSLGVALSSILTKTEEALNQISPNAVVILGDTNSAVAAFIAERMGIPVFHLEAGNRAFDKRVPEEINRRLVDHVSSFNLPYSEAARQNLLREGIHPSTICKTGSPLREVIEFYRDQVTGSGALTRFNLEKGRFFLVSLHRQENVDDPASLNQCMDSLAHLAAEHQVPALVSVHPRTRKRLETSGAKSIKGLVFAEPMGYFDYLSLQLSAKCVISDSGSISEEANILGIPAVTIRNSMERPEAIEAATVSLSGTTRDGLLKAVAFQLQKNDFEVEDYKNSNFSQVVSNFMLAQLSRA